MEAPVDWLLEGEPWVVYRTYTEIMDENPLSESIRNCREEIVNHPRVKPIVSILSGWPGEVLTSHKFAGHPLHLLSLMADFGVSGSDPGISEIIQTIIKTRSGKEPFRVLMNINVHFHGSGKDQLAWALCDAPLVTYSMIRMGFQDHPAVKESLDFLVDLGGNNGWPCAVSREMGRFRGPGRKDDPCPYATLLMLKCLALTEEGMNSEAAHIGVESLLTLWERSCEVHPYLFYMGTDFRKLKAPLVWYDLLHVLDVLSCFSWTHEDDRVLEMLDLLISQADDQGRYTPGSIWLFWKEWDFG